jgi:hypothetical protein
MKSPAFTGPSAQIVVKSVTDAKTITRWTSYGGDSAAGLGYAMGGKFVGQPWELKLPTNLVKIDNALVVS